MKKLFKFKELEQSTYLNLKKMARKSKK